MDAWLQRVWYQRSLWVWLLLPLSLLFGGIVALRRFAFQIGLLRTVRVGKPVIVVGNITVGGTGKTPLVIWLAQELSRRGLKPGVITRGYGGSSASWPAQVAPDSDPAVMGDEAVLLAQRSGAIVVAGPDRVVDAKQAIALGANVIISDDGLQHYRLARDFEIAVVDGARCFGNGNLLPAGPLRESVSRLDTVSAVVVTCRAEGVHEDVLVAWQPRIARHRLVAAISLLTNERRSLVSFAGRVHAVAGIGNPGAFFAALSEHGLQVDGRALADHAPITKADLHFNDVAPVFMTEKDAVKCRVLADERMWVVPIEIEIDNAELLLSKIDAVIRSKSESPHE
jgi:tetraacyldisaccharide 4'-kinase